MNKNNSRHSSRIRKQNYCDKKKIIFYTYVCVCRHETNLFK